VVDVLDLLDDVVVELELLQLLEALQVLHLPDVCSVRVGFLLLKDRESCLSC